MIAAAASKMLAQDPEVVVNRCALKDSTFQAFAFEEFEIFYLQDHTQTFYKENEAE